MRSSRLRTALAALVLALAAAPAAEAQSCGNSAAGFPAWLESFKQQAAANGIRPEVAASALAGVSYSPQVAKLDRSQRSFKLSFEQFYAKRVSNAMIGQGRKLLQQHRALFDRIERETGVPGEIIVAIWGLETGYGRDRGKMPVLRSLATLAYDCRRSDFFRNELVSALLIVQRGDMRPEQMVGAWAGEIGQTQFLASSYVKFAVDGDGDGRRDLVRSVPDVLVSTANYLRAYGWQPGAGWEPGSHNYEVLRQWNKASVYVQTISVVASKLAG